MLFTGPLFLFAFLPIVLTLFLSLRHRRHGRLLVLLPASLLFYLWSEPLFVPVVLVTCLLDHGCALQIARRLDHGRGAQPWLALGILGNGLMLVRYKYTGFAAANVDALLLRAGMPPIHAASLALPVGVSFIVFEKITYLVDIARRRAQPAPGFAAYLLYVFLFPKLLAGPIIKYHELEAQLRQEPARRGADLLAGFERFMLGAVKKLLLADTLAGGADAAFAADAASLGCADAWLGVLLFSFQIYIDFSAYSDMAIGLARMLGFRLPENFNHPYISVSITDFWRRWHISLSTWIRDYLYIPLGGNRVPSWRRSANLWICFLLSGLWHGAAWTFVAWGAYNGLFLALERTAVMRWLGRLPPVAATAWTFLITTIGWTLFRATSLGQAGALLRAMARLGAPGPILVRHDRMQMTALVVAACLSFLPRVPGFDRLAARCLQAPAGSLAIRTLLLAGFAVALAQAEADPFRPFLYFRF